MLPVARGISSANDWTIANTSPPDETETTLTIINAPETTNLSARVASHKDYGQPAGKPTIRDRPLTSGPQSHINYQGRC